MSQKNYNHPSNFSNQFQFQSGNTSVSSNDNSNYMGSFPNNHGTNSYTTQNLYGNNSPKNIPRKMKTINELNEIFFNRDDDYSINDIDNVENSINNLDLNRNNTNNVNFNNNFNNLNNNYYNSNNNLNQQVSSNFSDPYLNQNLNTSSK